MKPATHLLNDDGTHSESCFACKVRTVSFAPSAMVTRSPTAANAKVNDPLLDKDRDAYKRLRRDGEQPKNLKGSAALEATANESFEISTGQIVRDENIRHALAAAHAEMPDPITKPIVREPV
jgi:hypothetical protein